MTDCKSECMTIIIPNREEVIHPLKSESVVKSETNEGLWALAGVPVIGGAAIIIGSNSGGEVISGASKVPFADSAFGFTSLVVLAFVWFKKVIAGKAT